MPRPDTDPITLTITLRPEAGAVLDQLAREWGVEREAAANLCIIWGVRPGEMVGEPWLDPATERQLARSIAQALAERDLIRAGGLV